MKTAVSRSNGTLTKSSGVNNFIRIEDINQIKKVLNNKVLLRTVYKATEQRRSGIYLIAPSETDWRPAEHTNRISEVILPPESLFFNDKSNRSLPWKTEIEIKKGDIVWHDFMAANNCIVIKTDKQPEEEYKLLDYNDIYVIKRNGDLIPINGYILCEEVKEKKSDLEISEKTDKRFGRVAYVGKKNKRYQNPHITEDIDISVGDIIIKRRADVHILLESEDHRQLDKPYFIIQRKDIYGILL